MAKAKCGCDIDWSGPLGEIAFCPKHAAVDDLIAALEKAIPFLLQHDHGPGPCKPICEAGVRADAAIRKAKA